MRSKLITIIASLALALGLTGCGANGGIGGFGPKTLIGAGLGAAGGGLLGAQVGHGTWGKVAIAGGTLLGAVVGGAVGQGLDKVDQMEAERSSQQALNSGSVGQPINWDNPSTGNSGYTVVERRGSTQTGASCAQYSQQIVVQGRVQTATGTACQRQDGTWQIQG
jgi:surface antigen